MSNPFLCPRLGPNVQTVAAQDRIQAVRDFDMNQCLDALQVKGLQKTVETAVHRRIKQLEKLK